MAISELTDVAPPPRRPKDKGNSRQWAGVQRVLGTPLPDDYRDFAIRYGSGCFTDPGRLLLYVWNPFSAHYSRLLSDACSELRNDRVIPDDVNVPYGVFPNQPGWLPWGNDMDGNFLCWLTEGQPDHWPIILLSPTRAGFQQLQLPLTTFLAKAFTRQLQLILWDHLDFFRDPQAIRFVPER